MTKRNMFVGMDVHKESIDVSIAEEGRDGEVRHYGVIPGDLEAVGGPATIAQILEYATTTANLEEHIKIVASKAVLRSLIRASLG